MAHGDILTVILSCPQAEGHGVKKSSECPGLELVWGTPVKLVCSPTQPASIFEPDQTNQPCLHSGLWLLVRERTCEENSK